MSEKLILEPTSTAQWHKLIVEAEEHCHCQLDEDMESYLVFTLMRFMANSDLASKALATDYLSSNLLQGSMREGQLRDVGDQCLLLSGLFPQRADHNLVRVSYYVELGQTAYHNLGNIIEHAAADLYQQLAQAFIQLMDVLHSIRHMSGEGILQPLQNYQLWCDTHSQLAFETISENSLPVHEGLIDIKPRS